MFENLIKNQLLSGQCESAILCLQQCEGIIRGQKLEFSNGSLSGMRGGAVDNSPVCSLLSTELASCRQQNLKKKTTQTLRANLCHPAYKPSNARFNSLVC